MNLEYTGSGCGSARPACIVELLALLEGILQPVPDLVPGTLVFRLFLTPNNFIRVGVLLEQIRVVGNRERINLLDADKGNIVDALNLACFKQIVLDLAAAKYDSSRCFRLDVASLRDNQLKISG